MTKDKAGALRRHGVGDVSALLGALFGFGTARARARARAAAWRMRARCLT